MLQNFLYNKTITVRIQDQLSFHQSIQNGVPKGEVWSIPLFLIAIDISKCVTFPLTQRLFADDISSWASDRGFRFSYGKTGLVIFKKQRRSSSPPPTLPIRLQN